MPIVERAAHGIAECLTGKGIDPPFEDQTTRIVVAAEWPGLAADHRDRVNPAAVFRLASLFSLEGASRDDAVLAFARDYGAIGSLSEFRVETKDQPTTSERIGREQVGPASNSVARSTKLAERAHIRHVMGEPISRWHKTIRQLRQVCEYLHHLGMIEIADSDRSELWPLLFAPLMKLRDRGVKGSERAIADLTRPEKTAMLMTQLRDRVSKYLGEGEVRPVVEGDNFPLRVEWQPTTLRAALWLQIARLIAQEGTTRCRKCAECSNLLVSTGDRDTGTRADSLYCSQRCIQRGFRKRQVRARALHARGWSVDQIVSEMGIEGRGGRTASGIVKGWLGPRRRRRKETHG